MWQRALCHKMKTASRAEVELESEQEMLADSDFVTELAKRAGVILERKDRTMADICEYSIVITGPLETLQKIKVLLESAVEHKGNDYLRDNMIDCDKLFPEAAGASRTPQDNPENDIHEKAEAIRKERDHTKVAEPESIDERAKRLAIHNRESFKRFLVEATGCEVQDGWPCGTCANAVFHHMGLDSRNPSYHETHNAADVQGITISGILVCLNCDEAFASCDADPLCPGCREEEARREAMFEAVIEKLAEDYPGTVDYEFRAEDDVFDLLNEDDEVVATISDREMTSIWNAVEGSAQ